MDSMDRRHFLVNSAAAVGAVGVLGVTFGPSVWEGYNNHSNAESLKGDIKKLKADIISRNSELDRPLDLQATEDELVRSTKSHAGDDIELDPVRSLWVLRSAMQNLKTELERYPASLIKARVRKIVLMERANGWTSEGGDRGFAVPDKGEAYIGIPTLLRAHLVALSGALPRRSAHHELGHVFLGVDEETMNEWSKLNAPDFTYARFIRVRKFRDIKNKTRGFADAYGETDAAEDMATVFERMILEPGKFPDVTDPGDTILAIKVRFIKNHLRKISPEMNDTYWENLARQKT